MILATWNINGLRGYQKQNDLREFLEKYKIDILQLQETKLQADWELCPSRLQSVLCQVLKSEGIVYLGTEYITEG